jgi:hypothetical protein
MPRNYFEVFDVRKAQMKAKLADLRSFRELDEPLPEGIGALRLLQMVYRGEVKATPQQMRAAIECLSFENAKLSAIGVGYLTAEDFASRLDRAIERTNGTKLIEARAIADDERR